MGEPSRPDGVLSVYVLATLLFFDGAADRHGACGVLPCQVFSCAKDAQENWKRQV
jgi:hypothetical protein